MLQFILSVLLLGSIGVILYLVARSLPRIEEGEVRRDELGFWGKLVASEIPEKADQLFNSFLVKFLRKLKVFLLKIDNMISRRLKKIKHKNAGAPPTSGFEDM
ncbi:MAG: hypothetical protein WCX12_02430 [Candidatus Paceibacterota bacterium]|jgi:hypothetical protein